MMSSPLASESDQVATLVKTALHDTGGESVEGAFVDHWVSNAQAAIDALDDLFTTRGFTEADANLLANAIRDPHAPSEAVTRLLSGLKQWTGGINAALAKDPRPEIRAAVIRADPSLFDPKSWTRDLEDVDPNTRREAVRIIRLNEKAVPGAQARLRAALDDPDPGVRAAAADAVDFYRDESGAAALARRLAIEGEPGLRKAILARVAEKIARESIHVSAATLAAQTSPALKTALLRALNDDDDDTRAAVFHAFRRWRDPEVAGALFERLTIEASPKVRAWLTLYEGFTLVRERALPHLLALLRNDPSATIRTRVAFLLGSFGPDAVPALINALDDAGAVRAAAMTVGRFGALRAVPRLMREWARPANHGIRRDIENALRDTAITAAHAPPPAHPADAAARIQARIDTLRADATGEWPIRILKESANALPAHANALHVWALRTDGGVLRMDHEALGHPIEPETDPLTRFAVIAQCALRYPELADMIPQPPASARPCAACLARGEGCGACGGLGWR